MTVAADNRAAWLCDAQFRPNDVHNPLIGILHVEKQNAVLPAIALQSLKLRRRHGVEQRQVAILGRHRMIHGSKRQVGAADLASVRLQTGKSLCGGSFVDKMPVNVDERGLVRHLHHKVGIPNLFVQSKRRHKVNPGARISVVARTQNYTRGGELYQFLNGLPTEKCGAVAATVR